MANPNPGDKCARAVQHCAYVVVFRVAAVPGKRSKMSARLAPFAASPVALPVFRGGRGGHYDFGLVAVSLPAFLHADMNFLRSLPWMDLASASFEHSSEAAVRGFSIFFSAFALGAAGAAVCAKAGLTRNREAMASAAAREDIVIMESTFWLKRLSTSRDNAEPRMNGPVRIGFAGTIFLRHLRSVALSPAVTALGCVSQIVMAQGDQE
jgi:hypothetical protein